jgi:hypothetical protein
MTASAYDRLLEVLENVKHPNGNHDKATANCPAHDSASRSSLSVKRAEGKALLYCFGGCPTENVLAALGWTKADLYDDHKGNVYTYPDGTYAHRSYDSAGRKKFFQSGNLKGDSTQLYRLEAIEAAKLAGKEIWFVEGEDDVHALELLGVVATTTRGGVGMMGKADLSPLYGAYVNVVVDKDKPGDKRAHYLRMMLQGKARTLTFYQAATGKDAQDHIAADHGLADFQPYEFPAEETTDQEPTSRWMNLDGYLDGTLEQPDATIGGTRDDMIQFLYPGCWHTCIGLTTAGKTWWALWHVKAALDAGEHVIYIHFEEPRPASTIARLIAMGVDTEVIRKRFHFPEDRPWEADEMAHAIAELEDKPMLAVLDGINTACGTHGWDVEKNSAVSAYRAMFVAPLTRIGTTVLSLGHPVKAMRRQTESYSYGAAGWLNDVDGCSYRMTAGSMPIGRDKKGGSALHSVKDRHGNVERWGVVQDGDGTPWYYLGQFIVDNTPMADLTGKAQTVCHLTVPAKNEEGGGKHRTDFLAEEVLSYLRETTGKFPTFSSLDNKLRARNIKFSKSDLPVALEKLVDRGLLEWPEVEGNAKRPGWLVLDDE